MAFIMLLIFFLFQCTNETGDDIQPESTGTVSLSKSGLQSFAMVSVEIEGVEEDEVVMFLNGQETIAYRTEGNSFVFIPTLSGELELSIPSLNYTTKLSVTATSLGGKSPEEIYSGIETLVRVDSFRFDSDRMFLNEKRSEARTMFNNASADEKESVAQFFIANRDLINELLLNESTANSGGRISTNFCQEEENYERLKCLVPVFLKKIVVMTGSAAIAVGSASTGIGAIFGGIVGALITYPAFIKAREIGYEMGHIACVIVGSGDDEILNDARVSGEPIGSIIGGKALLVFEYSARPIQGDDNISSNAIISQAVGAISKFIDIWDKYIGNKLSNKPAFAEPYTEVVDLDDSMVFTAELLNHSDSLAIESVSVVEGKVEIAFNVLHKPTSDWEVSLSLANEDIKREILLAFSSKSSVQERLNSGETPFEIYQSGVRIDSLYAKNYQGGLIFHMDENDGFGLIVSPVDIGAGGVDWHYAVNYCVSLELDGYSDWYLPSMDEWELIRSKLKISTAREDFLAAKLRLSGGIITKWLCWTTDEYELDSNYAKAFNSYGYGSFDKNLGVTNGSNGNVYILLFRAVRAF